MSEGKSKNKGGRPSKYTQKVADEICNRLAEGESLLRICRDAHLPARDTVSEWVIKDLHGFSGNYTRSRNIGLDVRADKIMEDVEDDSSDVQRDRLKFDAARWYLSKLAPKKYGDKVEVEHGVNDTLANKLFDARKRIQDES